MNNRADARAEADLLAQGVSLGEPRAPSSLVEIEQQIDADASLYHRPWMRKLLKDLFTKPLTNPDGSPLVNKAGKPIPAGAMWDMMLMAGVGRAINGQPAGTAFELIWTTVLGKPREAMELSGPAGGPIESRTTLDMAPAEEIAAKLVRAQRIAQEVLARETARPALVGIEVSAKPVVQDADVVPAAEPDIKGAA
jgi:hypothetical protein